MVSYVRPKEVKPDLPPSAKLWPAPFSDLATHQARVGRLAVNCPSHIPIASPTDSVRCKRVDRPSTWHWVLRPSNAYPLRFHRQVPRGVRGYLPHVLYAEHAHNFLRRQYLTVNRPVKSRYLLMRVAAPSPGEVGETFPAWLAIADTSYYSGPKRPCSRWLRTSDSIYHQQRRGKSQGTRAGTWRK